MDDRNVNNEKSYSPSEFIITLLIVGIIGLFLVNEISTANNDKNIPSFSISPGLAEMLEEHNSDSLKQTDEPSEYNKPYPKEHQKFLVTIYDTILDYNNSVGNDWSITVYVNNTVVDSDGVILYTSEEDRIDIVAECTEWDSIPDIGENSSYVIIERSDFEYGFSVDVPVVITENRGRYSGNTAKWTITLNFKPIK